MLFDEQFVAGIRNHPLRSVLSVCRGVLSTIDDERMEWSEAEYAALTEGYALLVEVQHAGLFGFEAYIPDLTTDRQQDCSAIAGFFREALKQCESLEHQAQIEATRSKFRLSLGTTFSYEFTQGDLDRVQELLNELRVQISTATFLSEDHKHRLLSGPPRLKPNGADHRLAGRHLSQRHTSRQTR
jgi:hypothetical protein